MVLLCSKGINGVTRFNMKSLNSIFYKLWMCSAAGEWMNGWITRRSSVFVSSLCTRFQVWGTLTGDFVRHKHDRLIEMHRQIDPMIENQTRPAANDYFNYLLIWPLLSWFINELFGQRKAANPHKWEDGTRERLACLLEKVLNVCSIIKTNWLID